MYLYFRERTNARVTATKELTEEFDPVYSIDRTKDTKVSVEINPVGFKRAYLTLRFIGIIFLAIIMLWGPIATLSGIARLAISIIILLTLSLTVILPMRSYLFGIWGRMSITIDSSFYLLNWSFMGLRREKRGNCKDIDWVGLCRNNTFISCVLATKKREYLFASYLTREEQKHIVKELYAFLYRCDSN